jgi:hypothetical protein
MYLHEWGKICAGRGYNEKTIIFNSVMRLVAAARFGVFSEKAAYHKA